MTRNSRRPFQFTEPRRRGSALVITLLLTGVLAITVAAMLASVRHLSRAASDKLAMEECYHTALSGINLARAWIMRPDHAKLQAGGGNSSSTVGVAVGQAFSQILTGALKCSTDVYKNREVANYVYMPASTVRGYYSSTGLNKFGDPLPDGRHIIHEWNNTNGKMLVLPNGDQDGGTPGGAVMATNRPDARSWIERLTITTPFPEQDDMRFVSLIVEAEARTRNAGITKRRTLLSKVLVIPDILPQKPAQAGAAVIAGGGVDTSQQNNSSMDIHWGPVWSIGDITLLGLTFNSTGTPKTITGSNNDKYTGAGVGDEKWVRWQAGTGSYLLNHAGNSIFPQTITRDDTHAVVQVTDLISQMRNGDFGPGWQLSPPTNDHPDGFTDIEFSGNFEVTDPFESGYFFDWDTTESQAVEGNGVFVQNEPEINQRVLNTYKALDYTTWKNFAIANNGYIRPKAGGGFVNSTGQTLYVTPQKTLTTVSSKQNKALTSIGQLTMRDLVPANGVTSEIPDRILFVDSQEGTEEGTTRVTVNVNSSEKFFWKGLLWVHGNADVSGGGSFPKVWGQNPDQYNAYNPDPLVKASGQYIDSCFIDGIFRLTGDLNRTGNAAIYGSLVVGDESGQGVYTGAGGPAVYYNIRVSEGLFAGGSEGKDYGLVGGPIVEVDNRG